MKEPEFVRGNQKSYIRVCCDRQILQSYEYQMCRHNRINSFLQFQQRSQNGEEYLYFEISGMQSLDIFLQTQKLKNEFVLILAKAILKLCNELAEYALSIECVDFGPKYVMVSANGEEIRFLYSFQEGEAKYSKVEQLLECCIDHLDYKDELLTEKFYHIYECLLEQEENFFLAGEMEKLLSVLTNEKEEKAVEEVEKEDWLKEAVADKGEFVVEISRESVVARKEYGRLKQGLAILLLLDAALVVLWRPLTVLKLFFEIAAGGVLLALNVHVRRQDRHRQKEAAEEKQNREYVQEYAELSAYTDGMAAGTQIISMEDMEGVLYNLQNQEPQYIYINGEGKIIGKDAKRVQVHIEHESISRVHALVVKDGKDCFVEDLNSTNGTRINGKLLEPRARYVLKSGDKVCFADLEYIFR